MFSSADKTNVHHITDQLDACRGGEGWESYLFADKNSKAL